MRIAFDTGGTFTDCVYLRGGRIEILKVPSTPRKPSEAIAHALDRIRESRARSGRSRTRLRHHGWHERASPAKRRARRPGHDRGLRRRPRNWPASPPATLQSAVREARSRSFRGRGASACAKGWIPMAASCFRRPRGGQANRARRCPQRGGVRRRLLALFLCESGP